VFSVSEPDLPEHDHCRWCGNAVPFDQAYCCEECYYKDQARIKKEKLKETSWTVIAVAGIAAILVVGYLW